MTDERNPSGAEAAQRIEDAESIFEANPMLSLALCDEGKPWIGKVFYVDDQPGSGKLDLCCAIVETEHNVDLFTDGSPVAFLVGGEEPERWLQGTGTTDLIDDEADARAVAKRLRDRSEAAARFLDRLNARAVRVHVQRLRIIDLDADPPIAEFTFS